MTYEFCALHECKRYPPGQKCGNFAHSKSRGLCATCFNHGCQPSELHQQQCECVNPNHEGGRCKNMAHMHHFCGPCQPEGAIRETAIDRQRRDIEERYAAVELGSGTVGGTFGEPLTAEERASFRRYAEANLQETDGSECQWASYTIRLLDEHDALESEFQRLAGPVCEHDRKRAIEHCWLPQKRNVGGLETTLPPILVFDESTHSPAPAIEAWLRERSGR